MKKTTFLSLIVLLIISGCTQQEVKSPYQGAWKVVNWIAFEKDSLVKIFPGIYTGSEMTVIGRSHFMWGGHYKKDTTLVDNWGGGTYVLEGSRLEVTFLYCVDQKMLGTKRKMQIAIKNDTLTYSWPYNENWELSKEKYYIQKLIRLE